MFIKKSGHRWPLGNSLTKLDLQFVFKIINFFIISDMKFNPLDFCLYCTMDNMVTFPRPFSNFQLCTYNTIINYTYIKLFCVSFTQFDINLNFFKYWIKRQLILSTVPHVFFILNIFKCTYTFVIGFLEAAIDKITAIQKKSEDELEAKFKEHLQLLVDGQNLFMDNCHLLRSNERQIENDMVDILERILDRIDNKWEGMDFF